MSVLTTGRHAARRQVARLVVGGVPAVMRCAPVRAAIGRAWPQLGAYYASPATQRLSARDHTQQPARNLTFYAGLRERLAASGVPVEDAAVDLADFEAWLADYAELRDYYRGIAGSPWVEKCLEHYLAARWLGIAPGDTAVDVGAQRSPWAEILAARGVRSYRLDLSYPAGIHGRDIGADAGATRLPDGFCTVLTAHCSYEAFVGDSDVRFVREAGRILAPGGRTAILPLYLDDSYFIAVSPYEAAGRYPLDPGADRVWRDDGYRGFSRHYSPEVFAARVYGALPATLRARVLYFGNLGAVMERFPGQRAYCFFLCLLERRAQPGAAEPRQGPVGAATLRAA